MAIEYLNGEYHLTGNFSYVDFFRATYLNELIDRNLFEHGIGNNEFDIPPTCARDDREICNEINKKHKLLVYRYASELEKKKKREEKDSRMKQTFQQRLESAMNAQHNLTQFKSDPPKSKFQERLDNAMKAAQQVKDKKNGLHHNPNTTHLQGRVTNQCNIGSYCAVNGNTLGSYQAPRGFLSTAYGCSSQPQRTPPPPPVPPQGRTVGGAWSRPLDKKEIYTCAPEHYGQTVPNEVMSDINKKVVEKYEHLDVSKHSHMSIAGKVMCIHMDTDKQLNDVVFNFLKYYNQFDVKINKKQKFFVTKEYVESFKIKVDDFLNGETKNKHKEA